MPKKKKVAPAKKSSTKKAAPAKKTSARAKPQPKARSAKKAAAPKKKARAAEVRLKKKIAPKAKAAAKPAKKRVVSRAPARQRRDPTGHLDPQYAAELRERSEEGVTKDPNRDGFLDDDNTTTDDLAEGLAEQAVSAMTTGEDEGEEALNRPVLEEVGGPFVVTPAATEFAPGTDASNPKGAKVEPFPKT